MLSRDNAFLRQAALRRFAGGSCTVLPSAVIACVFVFVMVGGCQTVRSVPVRAATTAEASRAMEALLPLLRELDYPLSSAEPPRLLDDCKIGLVVVPSGAINAGARPGTRSPCVYFGLFVTEGAVTKLPVQQLRALFAHELAHVHLGHLRARRERAQAGGVDNWWLLRQAHDRAEESAADEFAARLLLRLDREQPGSCMALVFVFEMLAERPAPAEWLANHPAPAGRAERVAAICNGQPAGRS